MELDELLEDLQSALPPEEQPLPASQMVSNGYSMNGQTSPPHDHLSDERYERLPTPPERASVASTAIVVRYAGDEDESINESPFDDVQYSEVRKGPLYQPPGKKSPSPQLESTMSPPPSKPPRDSIDGSGGLSELDNLLAMLNDTQLNIEDDSAQRKTSSTDPAIARPSVGNLVDELTEVEEKIGGGQKPGNETEPVESEGGSTRSKVTASTATLELDELMQNLEKFEPPSGGGDGGGERGLDGGNGRPQKPKSAMDDLSSMLTSLDQDMTTRHGVNTVAKGNCAACNKPILGKVVSALGKPWHPEHFTCASCDVELGQTTYYESNGRPYCEKDYHELYAPRCAYCNGPILDRVMRALDKTWHPEHFFCSLCGKHFGPEGFHEKDAKAFCRECYYEKFAPRCKRCDKAIMEGYITALNAQWHPECFSCKVCGVTFPRGNYFEHEGEPHCEIHYHASRGTLCNSCQKPVTGKCITAMGKKWHPEHFNCAFCLKLLNKGTFKEHRHNPYCQPCYIKLFG